MVLPPGPSGHTQPTALSALPTCGCGPGRDLDGPSPVQDSSGSREVAIMPCVAGLTPDATTREHGVGEMLLTQGNLGLASASDVS